MKKGRWGLAKRLRLISLFVMDCDGTLTNGKLPGKQFDTKDGCGIRLLNMDKALISGDEFDPDILRVKHFGIKYVYLGAKNKMVIVDSLVKQLGINYENVCYIGDDVNDLECIMKCGVGVAVHDAVREVREAARYVTKKDGGNGAIRELTDLIRRAKDEG